MWQVVLGGVIALSGVLLTEWLTRLRDRSDTIRANTKALAFAVPIFTAFYSSHPGTPKPDDDYFGPFWTHREKVFSMLNQLRFLPRWPMRNAKAIRENAEQLLTMLTAVELRYGRDTPLEEGEQLAISAHDNLHSLVFGAVPPPDEELDRYLREGFQMPAD